MVSENEADVAARLDRLTDQYDPTVIEEREPVTPEQFEEYTALAETGYTGGGYAWVVREFPRALSDTMPDPEALDESYPRVLLALGRGADGWGPAGGGREGEETYEQATEREVREETGIQCSVRECRTVRHVVNEHVETGDEVHGLWVYFVAEETGGSLDVQESELNGAAWFRQLPDRLHEAVAERPFSWAEW